jgi:hypothetical protein
MCNGVDGVGCAGCHCTNQECSEAVTAVRPLLQGVAAFGGLQKHLYWNLTQALTVYSCGSFLVHISDSVLHLLSSSHAARAVYGKPHMAVPVGRHVTYCVPFLGSNSGRMG